MKSQPLVSILIPSYNHEAYITRALESILADTYSNKEVIILDDGSSDHSDEVIKNWMRLNDGLQVTFLKQSNKGLCYTLNKLIRSSKGKYLVFLGSDDELYGNTITGRVSILEQEEANGKLVLVSDGIVINEKNEITLNSSMENYNKGVKMNYNTDNGILYEVITNPSISGPTLMVNRKIYDITGYYAEDLLAEDWYFYQRAASAKAILFWDQKVCLYRVHTANSSGRNISYAKRIGLLKTIIKTYLRNIPLFPSLRFKFLGVLQLAKYVLLFIKISLASALAGTQK